MQLATQAFTKLAPDRPVVERASKFVRNFEIICDCLGNYDYLSSLSDCHLPADFASQISVQQGIQSYLNGTASLATSEPADHNAELLGPESALSYLDLDSFEPFYSSIILPSDETTP